MLSKLDIQEIIGLTISHTYHVIPIHYSFSYQPAIKVGGIKVKMAINVKSGKMRIA